MDTVLVVDDEPEILTALQDLLEEEHRVLTASSPAQALDMLEDERDVAVILSDQRMPGMTGDVFLTHARETTNAEALLLTGYADLDAVVRALNHGRIAGYSPKPWDPAVLRGLVAGARERYRLARALETERRLLHGLLDNIPDALSFKDPAGRFLRLNAAKAAALGTTVERCLGRREAEFLPPSAAAALEQAERRVTQGEVPSEATEEQRGGPREPRWFQVSRVAIPGGSGGGAALVTIERETTEARLLEARLRQADKLQALGTLAGGVAHDFNNLLTAILGSLRIASRGGAGPERLGRLIRNATTAAERGTILTQRLLSFSRHRSLALRPTDVNRLVAEMEDLLARTLGGMVRVERALEPGLWPAMVDPDQFAVAVTNLCVNARDAMPGGGTVLLATRNEHVEAAPGLDLGAGDYVVVTVSDSGTGIPPELLSRVFEPFFTTKEVGKGTGLGLPMVYGMVRQSGGSARITSAPGEGTQVELYLPRSAPAPESTDGAASGGDETPAPPTTILVVDDDPAVRETTAALLAELGHHPLEAADGRAALRLIGQEPDIGLVVTDFAMPRLNGLDLALQARALRPGLPVLLMTGYADLSMVPPEFPVLRKPFREDELAARIAAILAASPEG